MIDARLHEVTIYSKVRGGDFPFFFTWKSVACPASESVSFEIVDVAKRFMRLDGYAACEGVLFPSIVFTIPVDWVFCLLFVAPLPTH